MSVNGALSLARQFDDQSEKILVILDAQFPSIQDTGRILGQGVLLRVHILRFFLSTGALVSALASPAMAGSVVTELDEVVVTASRRPVATDAISSALSLLERDDVVSEKLVTDALANQAGVSLQQTTPGQGAAIIRGLKGSSILHLVDGMPLSNAIFRSAPTPYLSLVPTTAVDRIEVIRGTPASLYGSQAVGGVIQVVTRRPSFDSDETDMKRDLLLSFDTGELQKSIRGSLDIGNRIVAASISGEYLTTGDRRIGGGERLSPSGFTSRAARFVISATPTDTNAWLFDLQLLEQPATPRIDELIPGYGQTDPSSDEFFFAPSRRVFAHAQYTNESGWLGANWRVDVAWQRIDDDRSTRDFGSTTRRHEDNSSDLAALSINAAGAETSISWIVGADIQTDKIRSRRQEVDILSGTTISMDPRFPDNSRIDQVALFGNINWSVTARHSLSGGLRLTDVGIDVGGIDVQRPSGDLGWIYSFSESWQLVTNVGLGFRAPNIFDLGTLGNRPGNRFNIPNADLKEEHVRQLDVGLRKHSDNIQLELMMYALRYDDRITSVLTGNTTADGRDIVQSVNAARSSIHGAEIALNIGFTEKLRGRAIVNYTWGEETIASDSPQAADRIPPLGGELGLVFDATDRWLIESWLTVARRQDRLSDRDVRDSRINPNGTPGWAVLGARASWTPNDLWAVDMAADNLLDKRYRAHGSGIDSVGRNFSVTFRTSW